MLTISNFKHSTVPPVNLMWHPKVAWCTVWELCLSTVGAIVSLLKFYYFSCLLIWTPGWGQRGMLGFVQETDRKAVLPEASAVGWCHSCVPKLTSAEAFSKHLLTRQGKECSRPRECSAKSQNPWRSLSNSAQLHCRGRGGPWTKERSTCGGLPGRGERR